MCMRLDKGGDEHDEVTLYTCSVRDIVKLHGLSSKRTVVLVDLDNWSSFFSKLLRPLPEARSPRFFMSFLVSLSSSLEFDSSRWWSGTQRVLGLAQALVFCSRMHSTSTRLRRSV